MSHVVYTEVGPVRKRDVVDDLKDFIKRYDFYDSEYHRLWKDYEELAVKYRDLEITLARYRSRERFSRRSRRWPR